MTTLKGRLAHLGIGLSLALLLSFGMVVPTHAAPGGKGDTPVTTQACYWC